MVTTVAVSEANQSGRRPMCWWPSIVRGEAAAVAGLYEMASRQDPAFRAIALWAMSETGDTRFLPLLARFLTDPNQNIKAAAFSAMRKLRGSENSPQTQVLDVRILGKPWLEGSHLEYWLWSFERLQTRRRDCGNQSQDSSQRRDHASLRGRRTGLSTADLCGISCPTNGRSGE